jgi:hypothetical protein
MWRMKSASMSSAYSIPLILRKLEEDTQEYMCVQCTILYHSKEYIIFCDVHLNVYDPRRQRHIPLRPHVFLLPFLLRDR